jgi:hypothetical protein
LSLATCGCEHSNFYPIGISQQAVDLLGETGTLSTGLLNRQL